jgi:hypothetical protein
MFDFNVSYSSYYYCRRRRNQITIKMLQWSWKKFPPFWEVIHILQDRMYGEIFSSYPMLKKFIFFIINFF